MIRAYSRLRNAGLEWKEALCAAAMLAYAAEVYFSEGVVSQREQRKRPIYFINGLRVATLTLRKFKPDFYMCIRVFHTYPGIVGNKMLSLFKSYL